MKMGFKKGNLNIFIGRVLQKAAVTSWIFITMVSPPAGFFLACYLMLCTSLWLPMVLYFVWIYYDRETFINGGRPSDWMRAWKFWDYYRDYFPIRLVKTADLPADRNYLFCACPHGLYCSALFATYTTDTAQFRQHFPGLSRRHLTLDLNFYIPFARDLALALGGCSVSEKSMMNQLSCDVKGQTLLIVVGGAAEAELCKPGTYSVFLRKRKGFVRIALKTGTSLVPVLSFGETDLYSLVDYPPGSWMHWLKEKYRKLTGIALIIPKSIFPRRLPITTVVGKPLDVKKIACPSQEEIDSTHQRFLNALTELFEEHKHVYVPNHRQTFLQII